MTNCMPKITVPLSLSFLMSSNTQSCTSLWSPSKPSVENLMLMVVRPIISDSFFPIFVELTTSIWPLYDTKLSIYSNVIWATKTGCAEPGFTSYTCTLMMNLATHSATNRESKVWNLEMEKSWRVTLGSGSLSLESMNQVSKHRNNIIESVTSNVHNQENSSLGTLLGPVDPLDCGGGWEELELEAMVKTSRN